MANKISLTNTAIIVNNYDLGDCTQLERAFQVYDRVTHSRYFMGVHYDELNKKLYLPRGIDLWFVKKCLNETDHDQIPCIRYETFNDVSIKKLPRDDVQKEALRFMIGKQEYRNNADVGQISVNLNTGKGKTYVTIATMAFLGMRGIVITDSTSWLKQWKAKTLEYTDIDPKDVCHIVGSAGIFRLINYTDEQLKHYKLFLVTHDTIQRYGSTYGWDKITELFIKLKIGIKIFDEAHIDFDNMCNIDFFTNTFKTYYLTATPAKSADDENRIFQFFFKNIPAIDLFNEEEDPHTKYVSIHFNSNPTPLDVSKCKNQYGLNRIGYVEYLKNQPNYFKLLTVLMDLSLKLAKNEDEKILIYIGTNNAITSTYHWIIENFPELANNIGIYTSAVSADQKQYALTKKVLLSTTKSAGAALDLPGLKVTVVLDEPFKSEVIARQTLGRTRDSNTYYLDVVDKGFKQCVKFYYYKLPIFQKYATDCSSIRLNTNELDERYNAIIDKRADIMFQYRMIAFRVNTYDTRAFSIAPENTPVRAFTIG